MALISERMGKLENRSSGMSHHRLLMRIETIKSDPRYEFMFKHANLGGDTMAAVLNQVGKPLEIEEIELGELGPTDVLVRVHASGLCHTDLEVIEGSLAYPLPIVLGHEGAGVVEAVGATVTQVKRGDHVICSWNPHCGQCFYCERDLPILCEPFTRWQPKGMLLDGRSRLSRGGRPIHHFSVVSSHAQYCVVPESGAISVSREIPFDRACLIGCGVMTGVGAATRKARVEPGANVLVIGCGAVGLNVIQGAKIAAAGVVIAADVSDEKLRVAKLFGADAGIDASAPDAVERLRGMTQGRGPDYVFEAAGHGTHGPTPQKICPGCISKQP